MAVSTRLIKRRIKSVTNTRKITGAMELVAASKMRKATLLATSSRPYAKLARELVRGLTAGAIDSAVHPLLRTDSESKSILAIVITSDRGLAGGFNAQLLKALSEFIRGEEGRGFKIDYVAAGRKGQDAIRRIEGNIVASFGAFSNNPRATESKPIADMAIRDFISGHYSRVYIIYTDFISSLRQEPRVAELLPLGRDLLERIQGNVQAPKKENASEYIFEPNPEKVLESLLPRLVEVGVYQAVLESAASEHSARMVAMKSATDAAGDMIDDLTFTFNQARQAGITREISEIAAGKAALE